MGLNPKSWSFRGEVALASASADGMAWKLNGDRDDLITGFGGSLWQLTSAQSHICIYIYIYVYIYIYRLYIYYMYIRKPGSNSWIQYIPPELWKVFDVI